MLWLAVISGDHTFLETEIFVSVSVLAPEPHVAARSRGRNNFCFVFESKTSLSAAPEAKIVVSVKGGGKMRAEQVRQLLLPVCLCDCLSLRVPSVLV